MDMRHRPEAHSLRGLRGKRGTQAAGAEKHELLVLGEYGFVIRALWVDPELQHPSRAMEGAWHASVALQFTDIADVDQHGIVTARELNGLFHGQSLDLPFRGLAQGLVPGRDRLRHCFAPWSTMLAEPRPALKRDCGEVGKGEDGHGFRVAVSGNVARTGSRDMRMVDAQVTAALQNGAAFFASTSLIAI